MSTQIRGGIWKAAEPTPSPLSGPRGCMASPGCKHGKDGVQSLLPRESSYQLSLSDSLSAGQGVNTTTGVKKEELHPISQACSSPTSPGGHGSPKSAVSPRPGQHTRSKRDGSRRSWRPGLGMLTMQRQALPAAPPAPGPRVGERQQAPAQGRRGRRSPLPSCLPWREPAGGCPEHAWRAGRRLPPTAGRAIRMQTVCTAI